MFLSKYKEKKVYMYPCTPQFYYIKVGCKGVFITRTCLHYEHRGCIFVYTKLIITGSLFLGNNLTDLFNFIKVSFRLRALTQIIA